MRCLLDTYDCVIAVCRVLAWGSKLLEEAAHTIVMRTRQGVETQQKAEKVELLRIVAHSLAVVDGPEIRGLVTAWQLRMRVTN